MQKTGGFNFKVSLNSLLVWLAEICDRWQGHSQMNISELWGYGTVLSDHGT